jgi:hypothetical protein
MSTTSGPCRTNRADLNPSSNNHPRLIDTAAVEHFLERLGRKGDARFRAFPHKHTPKGKKATLGARKPCNLQELQKAQDIGLGAYVVINRGGDDKASITECIAYFAEFDGQSEADQISRVQQSGLPESSLTVRTGGGSLHFYWLLVEPMTDTAQWQADMKRLAAHLGSDGSINDPSRVMRLPGCWYMDGEQQPVAQVELIHETEARYSRERIISCLPEPVRLMLPPTKSKLQSRSDRTAQRALEQLKLIPPRTPGTNTRPVYLRLLWGLSCILGPEQAGAAMAQHSPAWATQEDLIAKAAEADGRITDGTFFEVARDEFRVTGPQRTKPTAHGDPKSQPCHDHDAKPYRILGWCPDRSRIHYQHRETGQIAHITPAAQAGPLLQLAPIGWWASFHPTRNGSGADWASACSDVIEQANRAGVFAPDRVRGRGLWMEGSSTVWHLGDRLEVDGQEVALIEHRGAHHYPRLPALDIDRTVAPLSDAEGREIFAAVAAMGWATPLDPLHLLGWAVLANVGGALDKRPVLQITSRFGSGKTFTRESVLQPLLAGLAISGSNSTEAGIRQLLRVDTLPVLVDESEGEDARRREGHLRLARLSYDGTSTSRGTTHGQALSYAIRSSVAMVGINATIGNPAERSRTVLIGREQLPQADWAGVKQRLTELLTTETGARLLRRAVNHLPTLRANVATFHRAVEAQLGRGAAARAGDTYGALLAGAHLLTSAALVDDVQALEWLDSTGWSAAAALGEEGTDGQDDTAESRQCLAHLFSHEEPWRSDTGTGRLSVRELLELALTPSGADEAEQARKALGRRGIRATDSGLEVANSPEALAPIYGRTKWRDGGHRARLRDLPGSSAAGPVRFPVLGIVRACRVPWELAG